MAHVVVSAAYPLVIILLIRTESSLSQCSLLSKVTRHHYRHLVDTTVPQSTKVTFCPGQIHGLGSYLSQGFLLIKAHCASLFQFPLPCLTLSCIAKSFYCFYFVISYLRSRLNCFISNLFADKFGYGRVGSCWCRNGNGWMPTSVSLGTLVVPPFCFHEEVRVFKLPAN